MICSKRRPEKRSIPPLRKLGHTHEYIGLSPQLGSGRNLLCIEPARPRSDLLVTQIDILRDAVCGCAPARPSALTPGFVLPDHMHCLWTLPQGDADFPGRWRAIKTAFVKCLPTGESRSPVMTSRGERGIWQRRYWEHTIRDDRDFAAYMDYTHFNPVKHGLVEHPADSPHSSFHRCVDGGPIPRVARRQ